MSKVNLFELAHQNSNFLTQAYESLRIKEGFDKVGDFADDIRQNWTLSINFRSGPLCSFLISTKYLNAREVIQTRKKELEENVGASINNEQALENKLGEWANKRLIFEKFFDNGENFKYCALYTDGLGMLKFGPFCVVLKNEQSRKYNIGFIKDDSLGYVDANKVDAEMLKKDTSVKELVHVLAALKHETTLGNIQRDNWAKTLCCDSSYIEAITIDEILAIHVQSVKLSKKDYNRLYDILYRELTSKITKMERYELYIFLSIIELLEKLKIKLEAVDVDSY